MKTAFHYQYIGGPRDGLQAMAIRLPAHGFATSIPGSPGISHVYSWDARRIAFVYLGAMREEKARG